MIDEVSRMFTEFCNLSAATEFVVKFGRSDAITIRDDDISDHRFGISGCSLQCNGIQCNDVK
jgi:hypothetical protein